MGSWSIFRVFSRVQVLFFVVFLHISFSAQAQMASTSLKTYVEVVAYSKTELLCYSIVRPIQEHIQSSRRSPLPISSPQHLFWRDPFYREALLEWLFLQKDALKSALSQGPLEFTAPDFQRVLDLHAQYARSLVDSRGFDQAIRDCANKYSNGLDRNGLDQFIEFLKETIEKRIFQHNSLTYHGFHNASIDIPLIVATGGVVNLVLKGLGLGLSWLGSILIPRPSQNPLGLNRPIQRSILQRQKNRLESTSLGFLSFFKLSKAEYALGASLLVPLNYYAYRNLTTSRKNVLSTNFSNAMPHLFLPHLDEAGRRTMRIWWNQKIENYEIYILQKGQRLQDLLKSHSPESVEVYNAMRELGIWIDLYMVDYWLVRDKVDRMAQLVDKNPNAYRVLTTVAQAFEIRKQELERHYEALQSGHLINANHTLEHLQVLFAILEASEEMRSLPYSYCTDPRSSTVPLPPLCRFHQLYVWQRLGTTLSLDENQEFQSLLDQLPQLLEATN